MPPQPLYLAGNLEPAYELRYSWAGWPTCPPLPAHASILTDLKLLWEGDGMRLLEHRWTDEMVQLTFSAQPDVSPVFLAARAKGRLQHALGKATANFSGFSRKVSVNAVGHNCRRGGRGPTSLPRSACLICRSFVPRSAERVHDDPRGHKPLAAHGIAARALLVQPSLGSGLGRTV